MAKVRLKRIDKEWPEWEVYQGKTLLGLIARQASYYCMNAERKVLHSCIYLDTARAYFENGKATDLCKVLADLKREEEAQVLAEEA